MFMSSPSIDNNLLFVSERERARDGELCASRKKGEHFER